MAYDELLADRVRELAPGAVPAPAAAVQERLMFGGWALLLAGNLAVGVRPDGLLVRVDPAEHDALLGEPGASAFAMRGRPMAGWLTVAGDAVAERPDLERWVRRGLRYAASLPPK